MRAEKNHKYKTALAFFLLPAFILPLLSGCAPKSEVKYVIGSSELYAQFNFDEHNNLTIQYSENEPEAALEEELSALDKVGAWDESPKSKPHIAEAQEKTTYDFPVVINKQVEFYLNLFQTTQRGYFEKWLARSTKYLPYIREQLDKAGLPRDLAYLAMIESGYNPLAYSKSHAVGLWQFMKATALDYDLEVDSHIDERRDPEKSAKAAIRYLSDLYAEFKSWYLAVASYNAGQGTIRRAIQRHDTRDFWKLAGYETLKLETKRYVPKLIAAIILSKNPEKYGFTNIRYEAPAQYDLITVPSMTDLQAVAMAGDYNIDDIKKLNTELVDGYTPPGKKDYQLKIPYGSKARVSENLSRLHPVLTTDYKTHVVAKGDTLTEICRRYNVNKTTLLKANNLNSAKLKTGQRLRIPYQTTKYVLLKDGETPQSRFAQAEEGGRLHIHVVQPGETLSKISKLYDVPPEIIMQWNNLESVHKINVNQSLALYLDRPIASQPEVVAYNTGKTEHKTKRITYYRVKSGDSLWGIAKKFSVSPKDIRRWNNLTSNMIRPGDELVIKKA